MIDPIFDLTSLDGTNGFILKGINGGDLTGTSSNSVGDVNGDGIDDVIVGARSADPNGDNSGKSYVVFGSQEVFPDSIPLGSLDGTNGFVIHGIEAGDFSGISTSSAGDVNGDGIDDLIIGASFASPNGSNSGASYVVFGDSEGFESILELSSLDGTNGFTINGIDGGDFSGASLSSAGDINADGIDDIIIGAPNATSSTNNFGAAGESYIVFGKEEGFDSTLELSSLDGNNGFIINGIDSSDFSGTSVSNAGDINGDGIDDIIIGANNADPNENDTAGESYIVFGKEEGFDSNLALNSLDGTNGFIINGASAADFSGTSVSNAGDVNGDGIDDIIIGAYLAGPNGQNRSGQSYVVYGNSAGFESSLDLSSLDGTNGFAIDGITLRDNSGFSVSGAGDVNGDGVDDVIIGAFQASPNGIDRAGSSYIIYGNSTGFESNINLSSLDGTNGFTVNGIDAVDNLGISVNDAGDVNGDGIDDVIIGADKADLENRANVGESYVIFGQGMEIEEPPSEPPSNPIILGTNEDDTLVGTEGDDTLDALDKNDYLEGLAGNDILFTGNGNDVATGQEGKDDLIGHGGHDTLFGGKDNDTLRGGHGRDSLAGHNDNDILHGDFGNDTLRGGEGRDILKGGDDNDILLGNNADDTLRGGRGEDIFFLKGFTYGVDTIEDFKIGEDRIGLGSGYSYASIEIGGDENSIISHNGNPIAILENVIPDSLSATDFIDL